MAMKRWILPGDEDGPPAFKTGRGELTDRVLAARGVTSREEALAFLSGGEGLHDPFLFRDMEKAVARIERAVHAGDLIVIFGDYDCDGMTATVLLYRYLEEQGAHVAYYIPDRFEEGYGLSRGACEAMHLSGAKLVITVDNGITAAAEIAYLAQLGVDAVVTDHHQPTGPLPEAAAVLNAHCAEETYPFQELAGVGVAFKLVCALEGDAECLDTLERYGDLVCIGTIADVVSLTGENRVIAAAGLRLLPQSELPGIQALLAAAGFAGGEAPLDAQSVSFGLAPRLNAASRMGQCEKSVDLMLCDDPEEAERMAREIDAANRRRKELEGGMQREIERQLATDPDLAGDRVLVLAGEGWHSGVIGIVAARMVERFGRPCMIIGVQGDAAHGSARSVAGFSIVQALAACAPLLEKFGGHAMAGGFSLKAENVVPLREAMRRYAADIPAMPLPALRLDAVLKPGDLDILKAEELSALEPFGAGNELPLFLLRGAVILEITPIGEGKHLRLKLGFGGGAVQAVYFGVTPERFPLACGEQADCAVQLEVSLYAGQRRLSVRVRDLRPAGFDETLYFSDAERCARLRRGEALDPDEAGSMIPDREKTARIYRALRTRGPVPDDADAVYFRLAHGSMTPAQAYVAVEALRQAGLIGTGKGGLCVLPAAGKADLEQTEVLLRLAALRG